MNKNLIDRCNISEASGNNRNEFAAAGGKKDPLKKHNACRSFFYSFFVTLIIMLSLSGTAFGIGYADEAIRKTGFSPDLTPVFACTEQDGIRTISFFGMEISLPDLSRFFQ